MTTSATNSCSTLYLQIRVKFSWQEAFGKGGFFGGGGKSASKSNSYNIEMVTCTTESHLLADILSVLPTELCVHIQCSSS